MKKRLKMYSVIACLMAVMTAFTMLVGGCATSVAEDGTPDTSLEAKEAAMGNGSGEEGEGVVAYCGLTLQSFFFYVEEMGVRKGAEALGMTLLTSNAELDAAAQTTQMENYITQGVDVLVIDAVDSEGITDTINKVKDQGIYTVAVDTPITMGNVDIGVRLDDVQAASICAEYIVEDLIEKYGEPKGKVVQCVGRQTSQGCRNRKTGFDEVMEKYPDIEVIDIMSETPTDAHNNLCNVLSTDPDIDALYAYTDSLSESLVEALQKNNRWAKRGEEDHVTFVGIDGSSYFLNQIKEGYFDASSVQDGACFGELALELLGEYTMQGKEIPLGTYENDKYAWEECEIVQTDAGPVAMIPGYLCTIDNVDDPKHWANRAVSEWGMDPNVGG